ncbi:phosphatase PAP2 family protein [uncultured Jannaschia sp.]|uniref:phosphatase PAP2 family protein n=1 Tax=uncultured Jannaschia sp. TaxID=293347 RepID=UPI00263793FA|nr:phosphatase PAP2 family protein [uncultured Jannaschia sp.]
MSRPNPVLSRIEAVGIAALLVAALFLTFPNLDLRISGIFGDARGFPLRASMAWNAVRDAMIGLTDGAMIVVVGMLLAGLAWPASRVLRTRVLAFATASYALGPGLLVNAVLKPQSGRARPWNVDLFGGDAAFTPVLTAADQCPSHCSFVSGEASALATMTTILLLVAVPLLPARHCVVARVGIVAVAIFGSLLRVAFGAHFLSDVVFAWLVSVPIVLALHAAFRIGQIETPLAFDASLTESPLQDCNPADRHA